MRVRLGHNLLFHLHLSHCHSEMACNITILTSADLSAIIPLHCIEIWWESVQWSRSWQHKKHLKNVGPIRHCEPPHAIHQVSLLSHAATVARRLRIDVHDNNDNAWQRGPLWPHRMGPIRMCMGGVSHFTGVSLFSYLHYAGRATC